MRTVDVHEAKTHLSALLSAAERDEDVVITRNGTPVVGIVSVEAAPMRLRGEWSKLPDWQGTHFDPAVFAPMTDEERKEEGWE